MGRGVSGLVRKNSQAAFQRFDSPQPQKKKRRLAKESQLPKSLGRGVYSGSHTRSTLDMVRRDKGSLSTDVNTKLPHALVRNKLGITYTQNQKSTPTSIAELLRNHVFGSSPDIGDP